MVAAQGGGVVLGVFQKQQTLVWLEWAEQRPLRENRPRAARGCGSCVHFAFAASWGVVERSDLLSPVFVGPTWVVGAVEQEKPLGSCCKAQGR